MYLEMDMVWARSPLDKQVEINLADEETEGEAAGSFLSLRLEDKSATIIFARNL